MVIVLDTGFIMAVRNEDDENHDKAKKSFEKEVLSGKFGKIIVTDYVFDETMTLILNRIKKKSFAEKTNDFILKTKKIVFYLIDDKIFAETLENYFKYFENGLSFTDCTFISLANTFKNRNFYIATFDQNLGKLLTNVV